MIRSRPRHGSAHANHGLAIFDRRCDSRYGVRPIADDVMRGVNAAAGEGLGVWQQKRATKPLLLKLWLATHRDCSGTAT